MKYGWHGFPVFARMFAEDSREVLYQNYTATMQKMFVEAYMYAHGAKPEIPSFIEMTHGREKEPTVEEIKAHILDMVTER